MIVCGLESQISRGLDCIKSLAKQHKELTILFGNIKMKTRRETELKEGFHGGTEVNLQSALGFYSIFGALESLLDLQQKHEMVTATSVELFPGVSQTEQKHMKSREKR